MSFVSLVFLVFMLVVYTAYLLLGHRGQNRMLLVASLVFYGWWDWRFLGLLLLTASVDWWVGLRIHASDDPRARNRWLAGSIVANLGVLGFFKYFNFFADSAARVLAMLGLEASWTTLNIVLPVGISFYTFQSMSYTIDVHRRHMPACRSWPDFVLFVSFFPQLVAGPIERAVDLVPRVQAPRRITRDGLTRGLFLILLGLFKKITVSDGVASCVDAVYNRGGAASGPDVIVATWLFAAQIYGDFAGYSDIARGLAKIMGFDLMTNFNQPYFAVNPSDFWRRWHISLSTWLRDYLYIPLGGNRGTERRTYANLMTTMVLGGLWHGAAWNYVLWGVYQGGILCVHRVYAGLRKGAARWTGFASRVSFAVQVLLFFQVVCYGWLLFRARSFEQIARYTHALLDPLGPVTVPPPTLPALLGLVVLAGLEIAQWVTRDAQYYRRWPAPARGVLYAGLALLLAMGLSNAPAQFIYFQF
jgi:D-alanyl-lipoteichoic acid acyltransferase DltB (MBOAT superfamily)